MKWFLTGKKRQTNMACLLHRLDQMEYCIKHVRQRIKEGKEISGLVFWRIEYTAAELDARAHRLRQTGPFAFDASGEDVPGPEIVKPEKRL